MRSEWVLRVGMVAAVVAGAGGVASAAAQQPVAGEGGTASAPEFEVATIKPHPAGDRTVMIGGQPGQYDAKNVTARMLVEQAYGAPSDQVSGGPEWTTTQRFNVAAKIPEAEWQAMKGLNYWQQEKRTQLMLQALLAERLQLRIRHEPRELQVYALVQAKGGAHLPAAGTKRQESVSSEPQYFIMAMMNNDGPVSELAHFLERHFNRTVLDQTGLTGNYDITLEVPRPEDYRGADPDSLIMEALGDQMGLKLESRKAVVDTIVIERIEEPSEN
jgi:uncharacterized protein (TIGR03435 family)